MLLQRLFDDPDHAVTVSPLLQPVYERRGDWQSLVGIFQVRVEASASDDEQKELLWDRRDKAGLLADTFGPDPHTVKQRFDFAMKQVEAQETEERLLVLSQGNEKCEKDLAAATKELAATKRRLALERDKVQRVQEDLESIILSKEGATAQRLRLETHDGARLAQAQCTDALESDLATAAKALQLESEQTLATQKELEVAQDKLAAQALRVELLEEELSQRNGVPEKDQEA